MRAGQRNIVTAGVTAGAVASTAAGAADAPKGALGKAVAAGNVVARGTNNAAAGTNYPNKNFNNFAAFIIVGLHILGVHTA